MIVLSYILRSLLDSYYASSEIILLGLGLGPYYEVGRDHKFSDPTIGSFNHELELIYIN